MSPLRAAFGLLTRIPLPTGDNHQLRHAAPWFPLVGLVIGLLLLTEGWLLDRYPAELSALVITISWITITGALHLDGAADLADGLGAAHGDADRLLAVMKEPHIGAFGVVALIIIILTKLVTLASLIGNSDQTPWALALIPAWARLGALTWMQTLKPLGTGLATQCREPINLRIVLRWLVPLAALTAVAVTPLFTLGALLSLWGWQRFLRRRVGGMNGDCLGAGIEYSECAMLGLLALTAGS